MAGKPAPPKPEPVMSPELLQKLADFEKTTADRIATEAEAPFQDLVATQLHKGYEAALGRLIETAERSRDLLTKASALRELERISALRPIEPEDPPEMPQAVKDARARYRVEIGKLEAQRDLLLLPILRDQLISIESLRDEFASLGKPALDQIDNAANPLRKRSLRSSHSSALRFRVHGRLRKVRLLPGGGSLIWLRLKWEMSPPGWPRPLSRLPDMEIARLR